MNETQSKYLELAPYVECTDVNHLEKFFHDTLEKGGEGIILRDPKGLYKPGRSGGYLKHKVSKLTALKSK